jgi:hypothetical protein
MTDKHFGSVLHITMSATVSSTIRGIKLVNTDSHFRSFVDFEDI